MRRCPECGGFLYEIAASVRRGCQDVTPGFNLTPVIDELETLVANLTPTEGE